MLITDKNLNEILYCFNRSKFSKNFVLSKPERGTALYSGKVSRLTSKVNLSSGNVSRTHFKNLLLGGLRLVVMFSSVI